MDNIIISLIGFFGFFVISAIVNVLKSSIRKHKEGVIASSIGTIVVSALIGGGYFLISKFPEEPLESAQSVIPHTVGNTVGNMTDQLETMASMMTNLMSLFALIILPIILLKVYRYAIDPQSN